jgi:hypothetical protein
MNEGRAIRRGALVAVVPIILWAIFLSSRDLNLAAVFLISVIMSIPFLAFAARVEQDGDLSSPRRKGTLSVLVLVALLEFGAWQLFAVTSWIAAPVLGIAVWFAAGGTPRVKPRRG